jgi:alpha-glucosidase
MAFWPLFQGRDGCRTPMPWTVSDAAVGFTGGKPWLPVPAEHRDKAVEKQLADPASVLHAYRRFVRWRREHPALSFGDIRFIDSPAGTMAFVRAYGKARILAVFNFNQSEVEYDLPLLAHAEALTGHGFVECRVHTGQVRISAYGAFFASVSGHQASVKAQVPD